MTTQKETRKEKVHKWELFYENYKELGKAIMKAGGNPYMLCDENFNFLATLANNNIELKCNYVKK
jgi:hypothetical protein